MHTRHALIAATVAALAMAPPAAHAQIWKSIRDRVVGEAVDKAVATKQQAENTVVNASGNLTAAFADSLLVSLKTGRAVMPSLSFDGAANSLSASSLPALQKLAQLLRGGAGKFRIEAFVDPTGDPRADLTTSQLRAAVIRDQLMSIGIPADRLVATGYGSAASDSTKVDTTGSRVSAIGSAAVDFVPGGRLLKFGVGALRDAKKSERPSAARIEIVRVP
jgi:outer membrane protein OmpA-like peptidoglycan-associated protein